LFTIGRVVGSRYLQKSENGHTSKISSSLAQSDSSPKTILSKPLTELKQNPVLRTNASNIAKASNTIIKVKSLNENRTASNRASAESHAPNEFENEQLLWAYIYQQCRLSLADYQREHDV